MADPLSVMKEFDAAWNAHDIEGVLAFFTDDAVVRPDPPPPDDEFGGVYRGKEQIRTGWVEPTMPGFHVESSDHQVSEDSEGGGQRVSWRAMFWSDAFAQSGAELPIEATGEVILEGDKIKSWVPSLR
jgi:hypothetical protein